MRTRFAAPAIALLLLVSACGDDTGDSTTTVGTGPTTTEVSPTVTGGDAGDELPPEMAELVAAAEEVRGLEFLSTPTLAIVSDEELARRVREDLEEELDPADLFVDQQFFEMLGLLDGTVDLFQAYTDLYAEQVAGFYDPDTGEMVVSGDSEISALSKMIIVHELVHALTDQHFGFADVMEQLVDDERYHEAAALQALAEGDATYFQIVYFQQMSLIDQVSAADEMLAVDSTILDSLPGWLGEDLSFPYDAGFRLVERIVEDEGIAGVDQAYRLLPTTTEQIIHPDVYFAAEPGLDIELPATSLDGYDLYEEGTLGEWNIDLMLLSGASPGDAVIASSGWGGDTYRILWNGQDLALAMVYVGDSPVDAEEFTEAVTESLHAVMAVGNPRTDVAAGTTWMTGSDYAFVGFDGVTVTIVAATDPDAGAALATQVYPQGA